MPRLSISLAANAAVRGEISPYSVLAMMAS
jgi:hypothetical protein